MAAVVKIYEMSASMSGTDKTNATVRYKLADNATVDSNNPITIPSSGYTRSFTKQLRLYVATAPPTQIDNFKVYSDGSNGFGTGVNVNATNAGGTYSANATAAMNGSDLFSYTSGSPLAINVTHSSKTGTGFAGDLMKSQMVVASTASAGPLTPGETIIFSYDET